MRQLPLLILAFLLGPRAFAAPPNVVIMFADDQGYADVGCYDAVGFETPNLDRIAREGMRFTSFYAAQAVCSASRAALLTGCYSNRVGVFGAYGPAARKGLNPDEQTIAEILKPLGYATACFGKWHLGSRRPFLPLQQGFDEYLGLPYSNDMWPIDYDGRPLPATHWKSKHPVLPLIDGNEIVGGIHTLDDQDTLTTRCTERTVQFIDRNADAPFFLYVPYSMPHVPLGVSDRFRGKSEQGMYGDVIMEIDWSVGEILGALERQGIADHTFVVFTSDNGPWLNYGNHAGSTGPLREGKGTAWEGGVRVPCIMRWPGHVKAGRETDAIAGTIDLLPTVAAMTGASLPVRPIDGVSLVPFLEGTVASPRTEFLYYYDRQLRAVRSGKWKLVFPHDSRSYVGVKPGMDAYPGPYARHQCGLELYDLGSDIGETRDVASAHPDVVARLQELGEYARTQLGDVGREGSAMRPCGEIPKN